MHKLFKHSFFLLLVGLICFSCNKSEDSGPSECSIKAYYRGTNVCYFGDDSENSAAIEIESNNRYLILSNFFEIVEIGSLDLDDIVYVEFEEVADLEGPQPLCGTAIVAPVTKLTCIMIGE